MQDDGKVEGAWMLEITRTCIQCDGSGLVTRPQHGSFHEQDATECPACIHGKERRTVTLNEFKHLLAMPLPE
jgi:hypothetical protein